MWFPLRAEQKTRQSIEGPGQVKGPQRNQGKEERGKSKSDHLKGSLIGKKRKIPGRMIRESEKAGQHPKKEASRCLGRSAWADGIPKSKREKKKKISTYRKKGKGKFLLQVEIQRDLTKLAQSQT